MADSRRALNSVGLADTSLVNYPEEGDTVSDAYNHYIKYPSVIQFIIDVKGSKPGNQHPQLA